MASPGSAAPLLRRLLLHMMLWVVALHATAIGIYHLADLRTAAPTIRGAFTVLWVAATFVLVSVYLRRIRLARRGFAVKRRTVRSEE